MAPRPCAKGGLAMRGSQLRPGPGRWCGWLAGLLVAILPAVGWTLEPVRSTWTGGDGSWFDGLRWNPPGLVPNNTPTHTFDVYIDGEPTAPSTVTLDGYATVDKLSRGCEVMSAAANRPG